MRCRLCDWLYNRLCPEGPGSKRFWQKSYRWEADHSNEREVQAEDSEAVRARRREAAELFETDPALALDMRRELAEGGSALAMRQTGWHYYAGRGTERDLGRAEHWYYQALLAGSWLATLELAGLLQQHRINERREGILENGVESGFLPACFWLAWFRYSRRPGRKTARAVRPLLEQAADAGHPGARLLLARWKMQGKFGLRAVREGWREDGVLLREFPCEGVE